MEKPVLKKCSPFIEKISQKDKESHEKVAFEKGEVIDLLKTVESVKRKLQALLTA